MRSQKGFAPIIILFVVAVVLAVAGVGYYAIQKSIQANAPFYNLRTQCYEKLKSIKDVLAFSFDVNSDFSKIQVLGDDIKSMPGIYSVSVKSAADNWQASRQANANNETILDASLELNGNPFPPAIEVTPNTDQDLSTVPPMVKNEAGKYGLTVIDTEQISKSIPQSVFTTILKLENSATSTKYLQLLCGTATSSNAVN